ncbi:hypothetical protein J6590_056706, partial [Homalodisca vitripennis]
LARVRCEYRKHKATQICQETLNVYEYCQSTIDWSPVDCLCRRRDNDKLGVAESTIDWSAHYLCRRRDNDKLGVAEVIDEAKS